MERNVRLQFFLVNLVEKIAVRCDRVQLKKIVKKLVNNRANSKNVEIDSGIKPNYYANY